MAEKDIHGSNRACCQPFVCFPIAWASISGLGLTAVGVYELIQGGHFFSAIYLLSFGILVLTIEFISVLALTCCRNVTCCLKCTKPVDWFDTWKRGLVYVIAAVFCFLPFIRTLYSIFCGIAMVVAGSLYVLKTCKVRSIKRKKEGDRKVLTEEMHDGQNPNV